MKKLSGDGIDSPMTTTLGKTPGMKGEAGKYGDNGWIGPTGVDGGVPLKFIDETIKTPAVQPTDNPTMILPAKKRSS